LTGFPGLLLLPTLVTSRRSLWSRGGTRGPVLPAGMP